MAYLIVGKRVCVELDELRELAHGALRVLERANAEGDVAMVANLKEEKQYQQLKSLQHGGEGSLLSFLVGWARCGTVFTPLEGMLIIIFRW